MMRLARLGSAALLLSSGCLGASDGDLALPDEAEALALGQTVANTLECEDEQEGDCQDWFRLSVAKAGALEVMVATVAGQGNAANLAVTVADKDQLTLAEAPGGGRPRFGVRWDVEPGDYFVWVRSDGTTRGELGYRVTAALAEGRSTGGTLPADATAPRMCLEVEASPRLNFFSGQPHVVRIVLYPLESALAFEQASTDALLRGSSPGGLVGSAVQVKVVPGETRQIVDPLPPNVRAIGVVADFYRPPGSRDVPRKTTLDANCDRGPARLVLGENGIEG